MNDSPLLNAREARAFLKCSRSYLTAHAEDIGVIRLGGRLRFRRADLEAYIARHYIRPKIAPLPVKRTVARTVTSGLSGINPLTGKPYGVYA